MRTTSPRRGTLAFLSLLAAVPSVAATPAPLASVERVALDNGLTVLLDPEPGSGLVSVGMMYTVGAKNEAAGTTGLAHYAEHMNFRATAGFPGHEITESITRLGGRWSGYTWIDQTFFQTTLGKEHLALALDIEAERMGGARYDEKDFTDERTSVIAELRSYDDPHALLYDEVMAASLQVHPYRNNTIGWLTDVESVSRDEAYAFYRRFYTPRNAVLVVGGDFARDDLLHAIRERFGSRPAGDQPTHVATVEPPQSGERRVTVRKPGPNAEVLLAFPAPALTDPDFPAMVLFDALFAGGKGLWFLRSYPVPAGTPLEHTLEAAGLRGDARTSFQASRYPYVYTLRATTPSGDGLAPVETALFAALQAAAGRDWTGDEVDRARRQVSAGLARDLDTVAGRVHQLAFFEVSGGYENLVDIEARLAATTGDAVRRFARERLTRDKATVGWFVPTPGVPVFAGGQAPLRFTRARPMATAPLPPPGLRAKAPTIVHLPNGLTLLVTSNPGSRLLALRGRIDAGAVYEAEPGLSVLAGSLFAGAARAEGAPPLVFSLDEDPADTDAARFIAFQASGLPADLGALARAVARGFGATDDGVTEARRAALERARSAEADTEALLVAKARATLFAAGSPLSRAPWASSEALQARSDRDVLAFAHRLVVPARAELSVAGPLPPAAVEREFAAAFGEQAGHAAPGSGVAALPTLAGPRGPSTWSVTHLIRPDGTQNTVNVVLPGDRSRPYDRAATSLLLYLLGETYYSGRLGRTLVEPGLVYSVRTTLEEPPGLPGYLVVRTAAARENTREVLQRVRSVLEDASRGAFTARELAEAKAYLRGKEARAGDGALATATRALEARLPGPAPEGTTLEQLNDTARRLFARGSPLALVGGPGE